MLLETWVGSWRHGWGQGSKGDNAVYSDGLLGDDDL